MVTLEADLLHSQNNHQARLFIPPRTTPEPEKLSPNHGKLSSNRLQLAGDERKGMYNGKRRLGRSQYQGSELCSLMCWLKQDGALGIRSTTGMWHSRGIPKIPMLSTKFLSTPSWVQKKRAEDAVFTAPYIKATAVRLMDTLRQPAQSDCH
jgi:hypothetical protein